MCERERESESVCVRERVSESVRVREREGGRESNYTVCTIKFNVKTKILTFASATQDGRDGSLSLLALLSLAIPSVFTGLSTVLFLLDRSSVDVADPSPLCGSPSARENSCLATDVGVPCPLSSPAPKLPLFFCSLFIVQVARMYSFVENYHLQYWHNVMLHACQESSYS